jgi:ribose transport system permease protein
MTMAPVVNKKLTKRSAVSLIRNNLIAIGILALIIATTVIEPRFFTNENIQNIIRQFGTLIFVALGMTFIIMGGFIDLSVSGIISLVVVVTVTLIDPIGQVNAIIVGILIGLACGLLNSFLILTSGALTLAESLFLTYGLGLVYAALALIYTKGVTQFLNYSTTSYSIFTSIGRGSIGPVSISFLLFLACLLVLFIIERRTHIGRSIVLMGENVVASRLAGVPISRTVVFIYAVSGIMTAIGAIVLVSRVYLASPVIGGAVGGGYETQAILAVVVGGTALKGGRGSVLWTVIGTVVLILLNNALNLIGVSTYIQYMLRGAILMLAIWLDNKKQISEGS